MVDTTRRPFAVITGGSSGIGLELANQCAKNGYDLLVAAQDEQHLCDAAWVLSADRARIAIYAGDLGQEEAVDRLYRAIVDAARPVDALRINAGIGPGGAR
jgi:short-subunit dehydrogenase